MKHVLVAAAIGIIGTQATQAADVPGGKTTTAVLTTGGRGLDGVSEIANDSDWYKTTLRAGQNYAFSVRADGCTVINLRNGKGKVLHSSKACTTGKGGYDGGFEYLPGSAGTYFVELLDKASKKFPSKYHVTAIADAAGSIKTAAAVLEPSQVKAGELNWKNDTDFFPVDLTARNKYTLSVIGYYSTKNISLRLADKTGKFVSGFNTLNKTVYADFSVAKTGRYYAVVTGLGNQVGGRYNIGLVGSGSGDGPGIPEGTYKAADGTLCSVQNYSISGRVRSYLNCDRATGYHFELAIATGSISSGHPYLAQLLAASVDKFSDAGSYWWGVVLNNAFYIGSCGYFYNGTPVGAQVAGKALNLSVYYGNAIYCSASLTKQ